MKRLACVIGAFALTGCVHGEDVTSVGDGFGTAGAYELTWADGVTGLNYLSVDGTSYFSRAIANSGSWQVRDGSFCFTLEGEENCFAPGTVQDDGTYLMALESGYTVAVRKLHETSVPGEIATHGAGAHLLTGPDGQTFLGVNTPDGHGRTGPLMATSSWELRDGKLCFASEGQQGDYCVLNLGQHEDGSWTALRENGSGVPYNVRKVM